MPQQQQHLSSALAISCSIGLICVLAAVTLRLYIRKQSTMPFGADDLMLVVASVFGAVVLSIFIYAGAIHAFDPPFQDMASALAWRKFAYLGLVLGQITHGAGKAAVVLFCKRIFITRDFTVASNIILGVLFGWTVSGFVAQIFSAQPISEWWTQPWTNYTFDWKVFFLYNIASNMVLDIIIWVLPMIVIRRLQMSLRRKLLLLSVFGLGLIGIFTSALRLYWAVAIYRGLAFHIALETMPAAAAYSCIWATIEGSIIIVVTCLPTFGPLFKRSAKSQTKPKCTRPLRNSKTRIMTTWYGRTTVNPDQPSRKVSTTDPRWNKLSVFVRSSPAHAV